MNKKFLSIMLVFTTLIWSMPIIASAETGTKYGYYLYYEVNDDNTAITITDCDMSATEIEIPSEIEGLPVTSIAKASFSNCSNLTNVSIPYSVTSIGNPAFSWCPKLSNISVDENNSNYCSVDGSLFNKEKTILIQYAVGKANTEYTIHDGVISIGRSAFLACESLTSITIPNSVTNIESEAFAFCINLINITFPLSVTHVGSHPFFNTAYYNDKTNWENGVLYTGNCLIEFDNSSISEYEIKKGTKVIADAAFMYDSGLKSITIPDSVISIGKETFRNCGLTDINISGNITTIGKQAFQDCTKLTNINVSEINPNYCSIDGNLFNKEKTTLIQYAVGKANTEYTIPNGVTSMDDYSFSTCYGLKNIIIPNSVTSISNHTFSECYALESITIPDSITSIGNNAFSNCDSLGNIAIPNSVTNMGISVFYGCDNLKSITLPNAITNIGHSTFAYCRSLTNITIPDSVVDIGNGAFNCCENLTNINIPYGITSINNSVFGGCSSLTNIILPESITNIGYWAFENCFNLTTITIPNNTKSIDGHSFANCFELTDVTIPVSVTSIGADIFDGCDKLTDIYYNGTKDMWNDISIDYRGYGNDFLLNATIHYNYISTTPDTYKINELKSTQTGVALTVQTKETVVGKQTVIVACYDENGIFMGLQEKQITASDTAQNISVDFDKTNVKTVKTFIWNDMGYMMPASRVQSIEL